MDTPHAQGLDHLRQLAPPHDTPEHAVYRTLIDQVARLQVFLERDRRCLQLLEAQVAAFAADRTAAPPRGLLAQLDSRTQSLARQERKVQRLYRDLDRLRAAANQAPAPTPSHQRARPQRHTSMRQPETLRRPGRPSEDMSSIHDANSTVLRQRRRNPPMRTTIVPNKCQLL